MSIQHTHVCLANNNIHLKIMKYCVFYLLKSFYWICVVHMSWLSVYLQPGRATRQQWAEESPSRTGPATKRAICSARRPSGHQPNPMAFTRMMRAICSLVSQSLAAHIHAAVQSAFKHSVLWHDDIVSLGHMCSPLYIFKVHSFLIFNSLIPVGRSCGFLMRECSDAMHYCCDWSATSSPFHV